VLFHDFPAGNCFLKFYSVVIQLFAMKRTTAWTLFVAILCLCSVTVSGRLKIIGGTKTSILQFPHQLAFLYNRKFVCGASLISNSFSLTAAHCTHEFSTNLTLRAGSSVHYMGGVILKVVQFYQHPQFSVNTYDYDVSVLKFDPPIERFTSFMQPARLATNVNAIIEGTSCQVSGWGFNEQGAVPDNLQSASVQVYNQKVCQQRYNTSEVLFILTDRMLCAGDANSTSEQGNKDACSGKMNIINKSNMLMSEFQVIA